MFGVNIGEHEKPVENAREFVKKNGVTYPTLMDIEGRHNRAFQIRALPTVAVIDRKGVLRYLQTGFDEDGVIRQIEALLAEPA